jgi:hypothetical protein
MKTSLRRLCLSLRGRLQQTPALLVALGLSASPASTQASIAYGSINNFDTVNDTGRVCHGFEIEIEDCHTTAITYTYNYNHYGVPKITQDDSIPGHPKTCIRWESKKNADGSWAAHTAIPTTTISPTDGHQFTNPSVNFGGEHFGVGYNIMVGAIHYNWLVDNGSGVLVHGGAVQVSTPVFTYYPPVAAAPAQVQAVIVPPPPPAPEPKEFGKAVWMKEIKTTTHNSNEIKLRELVSDDPDDAHDKNWANGEPDEVEVEWRLLQKRNTQPDGGPNNKVAAAPEDLPNGDEVVTRRYEFFKYTGPVDAETGEAMADAVDADGVHGSGTVTYADHFNPATGEWQTITTDLSTLEVVGDYTGAQMAAVDVDAPVGLIDHVGEAEVGTAYAPRTVVIEGALPFTATQDGSLPPGMAFDEVSGVLSGTPTTAGVYAFQVTASDGYNVDVEKNYTMTVTAAGAEPAPASLLDTSCSPVGSGTTTGDSSYAIGANATVTATAEPGYHFLNWTDNGLIVGTNTSYSLAMDVNHSLVANFAPDVVQWNITTSAAPVEGGTTTGDGLVDDGLTTTVTATANAGYVFSNWTEDANIVSTSSSYTFTVTANRSLVANFSQSPSFSVTTTAAPSAGGSTTGGGSYASGSSVTVTAAPNLGYAFINWTQGGAQVSASASYTFTVSASRSLVANFALIGGAQYVITTAASPLAGGTLTGAGSYAGGSSVTVTATAAPGYKFSKWKENGASVSTSASYTFTATAGRSLTASFIESYTVTLLSSPPSGGSTEADSSSYKRDENARVDAFPNSGYQFVNWTENGTVVSSSNPYDFNVTGSRTLVANFAVIGGVSISASAAPVAGGTVTGGGSVVSGTPVTLTATPNAGYGFINWTENGTEIGTSPGYSFTASASRTLVANFAAGSTLSTSSNPSIGGSTSGGGFVPAGNSVTLLATASPGYTFLHWTDATGTEVSTSASHTFTPAADGEYVAHFLAPAIGVHFDFDTSTPVPSPDDVDPLDQTAAGITATFSGAAPGDFKVTTEALGARTLSLFNGNHLESTVDGSTLTIQLSSPATGVSLDFATVEALNIAVPSTLQLTAFDTSSGLPVVVGNAIAHGTVTAGDSLPVGTLTFNSGAGTFDQITLQLPDAPAGALRFLVDNLLVSPGSSTGGSLSLANPNWNITLTDFGYSDFLLDNTPGFEGREYLSGEWGSAVAYNRNGQENSPKWLEPNFLYPDWQTNSDFHVVEGIHVIGTNLDGLPIAQSVIANNDLEVTLRFEMVDTITGTPMGVKPASAAGEPLSVKSNRYVMNQTFTVKNISGTQITNLQLFHLLHGFISQRGQFDNRSYVGNLAEYQHDITMSGVDAGAAGAQSSSIGLEDLIGFHSKVAPSAFEIGHYGIENNGIDDHASGKPSDGVHLSIEDNWTNAPYLGRKNRDSFAPADRWISGAQRWELGSLTPGQSVSFDIILSLLTGTKVVVDGGGTTGTSGHGSCNGGSSHAGGVDFEFEDIDQEGTFFGEYSEADDDEMLEREDEGEFTLPAFETPNGTRRQRWNLKYNGSHTGSIKLKFAYNPALLPAGYDENQLCIYHFNNGVWEKLTGKVNPATNTIEAVTPGLSPFMLGVNDVTVKPDVSLSADTPGALSVSWPDSFTGWTLQENTDLSPAGWFNSTRPLSTANGTTTVSVPLSSGSRFFRLVKP